MKPLFYLLLFSFVSACTSFDDSGNTSTGNYLETGSSFSDDTGYDGNPTAGVGNDPYSYLNVLRKSAGMKELASNDILAMAAESHASYLVENGYEYGHFEEQDKEGFSGVTMVDRVVHAGYHSLQIGEGISIGVTSLDAVDNLMSAIYHRFTLVDVRQNEIGMAFVDAKNGSGYFVHNIGNRGANELCEAGTAISDVRWYTGACNPDFNVSETDYNSIFEETQNANPQLILWPPPGSNDIPPAFFEESPDPLPDYSVSGYPVSVQFNPGQVESGSVSSFRLYDTETNEYISQIRQLKENTDPNEKFTSLDYALFPLQRLDWGRTYRVEIEYTLDGDFRLKQWEFTTRNLQGTTKQVGIDDTSVIIENGAKTNLYFTPADGYDIISQYQVDRPSSANVQVAFIDQNTLAISAKGDSGDVLQLYLNDDRKLNLYIN